MRAALAIVILLAASAASATTVGDALQQCQLHVHVPARGQQTWDSEGWHTLCVQLTAQVRGDGPADPSRASLLGQSLTTDQQTAFDGL
jgi:hypothetical protein